MAKRTLQWLQDNADLAGDVLSILVVLYFLFRSQTVNPEQQTVELLFGILGVLTTLAITGIIEKKGRLTRLESISRQGNVLLEKKVINRIRADEFFQKGEKPDQEFFSTANTIYISGITLGSTIGEFNFILGERLKAGAKIRILLLSQDLTVLNQIVLRSWGNPDTDYYRKRLENTETYIQIIGKNSGGAGSLAIGFLPYVPSFGIIMIDPDTTHGSAYVEIYHHNSQGPGPAYRLTEQIDPYWFKFYRDQFEIMWEHSDRKVISEAK